MTATAVEPKLGHSMPPEGPHAITTHMPGWQTLVSFRDGDRSIMPSIKTIYPRFTPWGHCRQLVIKLHKFLSLPPSHSVFPFLSPDIFEFARRYAYSHHRKENRLSPGDLSYRIVDVGEGAADSAVVRIYLVVFPLAKMEGVSLVWGNPGTGVSTRLAESLLPAVDAGQVVEVPFDAGSDDSNPLDLSNVPPPTGVPESDAHAALRERIAGLLRRAPVAPDKAALFRAEDVFLYQTGMAAIYRLHEALAREDGAVVTLGSVFHNTWLLLEEGGSEFKHFGRVDGAGAGLDELEAFLAAEAEAGRKISYAFVEFPSNPILVSADLARLRALADRFDFVLVVDDTIGSFANVDLSAAADIVMTSTTKSFSGYADVMGGSLALNRASPRYASFRAAIAGAAAFRNESFAGDAETLLRNSADYLARSAVLNRNARALVEFLDGLRVREPGYGITRVLYPTTADTRANYEAFMRVPTDEFTPGYGCLFSVEFEAKDDTRVFYDNLRVYQGPHLGAHHTLALCFNEMVLGRDPEVAKYHSAYGAALEQVRISVGLEPEEELIEKVRFALEKVKEARKSEVLA